MEEKQTEIDKYIFKDETREVMIEKLDVSIWLLTGEQYCPECHIKTTHKDGYYECPECNWSITDEEAEDGEGYPTEEASHDKYFN
ncbi:MAG: hypothetical protein R3Y53_01955 [Bacillota bacterium]